MKPATPNTPPLDDFIQTFMIDHSSIRGQFVRLDTVAHTILSRHSYPDIVSMMLAEMLVVAAILSQNLKSEGILTIQAKGDGPLSFLVVDAVYGGDLRGYAQMKEGEEETLKNLTLNEKPATLSDVFGKGYLAITLDMGANPERYQSIVDLAGATLSDAMKNYFTQSQQVEMNIKLGVELTVDAKGDNGWRAAGMMIERLPRRSDSEEDEDELSDQWNTARIFMDTLKNVEMLEPSITSWTLLNRLFGMEGVWAYQPHALKVGCRCNREKIETVLRSIAKEEMEQMLVDGVVSVNCQFCNKAERFSQEELNSLYE